MLFRSLLKEGVARLVASDAHQPQGRSPNLSSAASIIHRQLGKEAALILLEVNPGMVLAGESLVDAVEYHLPRPKRALSLPRRKPK